MHANSGDPAVLHCRVICLDYGQYLPALGIILTEHGLHEEARSVNITNEGLYDITYEHIQSCNLSNNIDLMEFQYSFYPWNVSMHKTVLTCGVIHPLSQPPCWAQSYAVIHYYEPTIPTTDPMTPTTTTLTSSPCTTVAVSGTGGGGGNGLSEPHVDDLVEVFSPITAILALALVVVISIAVIEGVFIAVRHRSPPNGIIPQNLHTPDERNLTPPKEFTHA